MSETRSERESYLKYARTVLGINSFLRPVEKTVVAPEFRSPTAAVLPAVRLFALLPVPRSEFPLKSEISDLLSKMIRAMKLEPSEVVIGEWVDEVDIPIPDQIHFLLRRAAHETRPVILFGSGSCGRLLGDETGARASGDWCQGPDGSRVLLTYSPFELIASPAKKSQTWTHLQDLMKHLTI